MPKAGLFAGEVTQAAPADNAVTSKQKGYQWMEYGNAFIPTSGTYSATAGYAITYEGSPPPVFPHPWELESHAEFTMSNVFKANVFPDVVYDRYCFNIQQTGSAKGPFIRARGGGTPEIYVGHQLAYADASNFQGSIVQAQHEITLDHPTWSWDDWYWMGISYSKTLNKCVSAIVNLTMGEEYSYEPLILALENVSWPTSSGLNGMCCWGCRTGTTVSVEDQWLGYQSQIFIHNAYTDLSSAINRRKFSGLDGVKSLGVVGENVFGVTPQVYCPTGLPSGNVATKDIGTYPTDYWVYGAEEIDDVLPPVAS